MSLASTNAARSPRKAAGPRTGRGARGAAVPDNVATAASPARAVTRGMAAGRDAGATGGHAHSYGHGHGHSGGHAGGRQEARLGSLPEAEIVVMEPLSKWQPPTIEVLGERSPCPSESSGSSSVTYTSTVADFLESETRVTSNAAAAGGGGGRRRVAVHGDGATSGGATATKTYRLGAAFGLKAVAQVSPAGRARPERR